MAAPFLDFTRAVRDRYSRVVSDGILEATPIWKEIQRANGPPRAYAGTIGAEGGIIRQVNGNNFQWRILKGRMPSGRWGSSTEITFTTPDLMETAQLSHGGYRVGYFMPLFELISLQGEEQIIPLLKLLEQMAAREWLTLFEEAVLQDESSSDPPGWGGLPAFMATSGTYAGNVDLSQSWAQPAVFDYSGSGESFAVTVLRRLSDVQIQATHGDVAGADKGPKVVFMSRSAWQQTKMRVEDARHIVDVDVEMLKLGFTNLIYNGMRIYWADAMTSLSIDRVYLLNPHYLGVAHPGNQLTISKTVEVVEGVPGMLNLSLHKGQFFCTNTRVQGMLDNISQT